MPAAGKLEEIYGSRGRSVVMLGAFLTEQLPGARDFLPPAEFRLRERGILADAWACDFSSPIGRGAGPQQVVSAKRWLLRYLLWAMKPRVYIETTIPSFYHEARTSPDVEVRRDWTRQWWSGAADDETSYG
jgi:hypothetical protein